MPFSGSGPLTREGVRRLNALANRMDVYGGNNMSPVTRTPTGTIMQHRTRLPYREAQNAVQVIVQAAADIEQYAPFALGTPITTPINGATLDDTPVFNSAALTDGKKFGIALDAIAAGDRGDGLLVGLVPAQVVMSSTGATDTAADIVAGVLTSAPAGYARIVWAAGTSGSQWCLLALPAASGTTITPPGPNLVLGSDGSSALYWYATVLLTTP